MPGSLRVELDVYSGRANPAWTLTGAARADFLQQLGTLPPTAPRPPAAPLGYRGFVVTWSQGSEPHTAIVQFGRVTWASGEPTRYLADTGQRLERWLLESGRARLDPAEISIVEQHLGPASGGPS